MAKFKYNGDRPNMDCFGLVFRVDGENVEAETDDKRILGKLRGNSHFDEVVKPELTEEEKAAKKAAADQKKAKKAAAKKAAAGEKKE